VFLARKRGLRPSRNLNYNARAEVILGQEAHN
jgi:hypothetical protein